MRTAVIGLLALGLFFGNARADTSSLHENPPPPSQKPERVKSGVVKPAVASVAYAVPLPSIKPGRPGPRRAMFHPLPRPKPDRDDDPVTPTGTSLLALRDLTLYRQAFRAAGDENWAKARTLAAEAADPRPGKALEWLWLRAQGVDVTFEELAAFMEANPDWPHMALLRRRAEEAIGDRIPAKRIIDWFGRRGPVTGNGMVRLGEALIAAGRMSRGIDLVRRGWREGNFSSAVERAIYKRHRRHFTADDHRRRLDRLLWEQRIGPAKRMYRRVNGDLRKLANARIHLMTRAPGVDRSIDRVPEHLQGDPGLTYERVRWRRRKGRDGEARELLLAMPPEAQRNPEKWWVERHIQARNLLRKGFVSEAYRLTSNHGLSKGSDFATAEWLSGWIALRFLDAPERALAHFTSLYSKVRYPISLARGAYWAGRAALAMGKEDEAQSWFRIAYDHPHTYYGQMAALALERPLALAAKLTSPAAPGVTAGELFEKREMVRIVRLLGELGQKNTAKAFLIQLGDLAKSPEEQRLTAALAQEMGWPDLGLTVAKRAEKRGIHLAEYNWPLTDVLPEKMDMEPALAHAVIRQESAFDAQAVSRVGAAGLMQLMPATAKRAAQDLDLPYSKQRLLEDPAYNAQLGSHYLASLIDKFDGAYILALAAYNAGEGRVDRWIEDWGDPRLGEIDPVDWVELIPFSETRNYVQRNMENLQVYRQRLAASGLVELRLDRDLQRGNPTVRLIERASERSYLSNI